LLVIIVDIEAEKEVVIFMHFLDLEAQCLLEDFVEQKLRHEDLERELVHVEGLK
jgi:hypothetical protein